MLCIHLKNAKTRNFLLYFKSSPGTSLNVCNFKDFLTLRMFLF